LTSSSSFSLAEKVQASLTFARSGVGCTNFNSFAVEDRRRLGNAQINFAFRSACTNFSLLRNLKLGGGSEKFKTCFGFSLALHEL
jgi:hypothetical protein